MSETRVGSGRLEDLVHLVQNGYGDRPAEIEPETGELVIPTVLTDVALPPEYNPPEIIDA